jgi:predicted  nucleic acid-binding Zn-ribbon protein
MNENERSLAEEITEGFDALEKIRQLESDNEELKSYNTELHGIEHDLEMKLSELQTTVRSFFQDFIDIREESDSGRVFAPITISSSRCMMTEPLAEVLAKMRRLSGS